MSLDLGVVGVPGVPQERTWTSKDALLYAVGVGAGLGDPLNELQFTTENCDGIRQTVLPTYATVLARQSRPPIGDFDTSQLVAAEDFVELCRPIPVEGTVRNISTIVGIYDKGSGALVTTETVAVDVTTGEPLIKARNSVFIKGEGGFGGDRGPVISWERPNRQPDYEIKLETRPEQALIYRLSGDRNPLHSDPVFARRGGFSQPILHGLCTYGITGRALLSSICGSDPARFRAMYGRFSSPVIPGDTIVTRVWLEGDEMAQFQTVKLDGTVVIDLGRLQCVAG